MNKFRYIAKNNIFTEKSKNIIHFQNITEFFCCTLFIFLFSNDSIKKVIKMKIESKLIGIRIMQRRKELGLSQEQLSELIGFSKNHISNIERGKYVPTTRFVFQICTILGGTPDYYLIGRISEETDELLSLIQQLPLDKQKMLNCLLSTYISKTNND